MGLTRCKIFGKILHLLLFVIFITIDPSPAKPDQDDARRHFLIPHLEARRESWKVISTAKIVTNAA